MVGRLILVRIAVEGGYIEKHVWVGQDAYASPEAFQAVVANIRARYNISPGQEIEILKAEAGSGKRRLTRAHWGFHAKIFNKQTMKTQVITPSNARLDKLLTWKVWRDALQNDRCAIPASAFYEWQKRRDSTKNVPWEIRLKGHDTFYMPGICQSIKDEETGESILETVLITQPANSLLRWIHNQGNHPFRQPCVLEDTNIDAWLDPNLTDHTQLINLLRHIEDGAFEARILDRIGDDAQSIPPKPRAGAIFISGPQDDPEFQLNSKEVDMPMKKSKAVETEIKSKKTTPVKSSKKASPKLKSNK